MEKNIKIIIIGIVILLVIGSLIFVSFDVSGPGSLIGGLAVIWAGVKSNIFGKKTTEEKIDQIKSEHNIKREEWQNLKNEYDTKFRLLQAQMQYIDYKSALISEKIGNLDDFQKKKLKEIEHASSDELLNLLNDRTTQ
ncbi:MAG TPA: hypothetical protein VKA27_15060 [Sunxiuqinia sp.]|nr:hypothetical protein [Sunxiuqinia sp.]